MRLSLTRVVVAAPRDDVTDFAACDYLSAEFIRTINLAAGCEDQRSRIQYASLALDELVSYGPKQWGTLLRAPTERGLTQIIDEIAPGPVRIAAFAVVYWLLGVDISRVVELSQLADSKGMARSLYVQMLNPVFVERFLEFVDGPETPAGSDDEVNEPTSELTAGATVKMAELSSMFHASIARTSDPMLCSVLKGMWAVLSSAPRGPGDRSRGVLLAWNWEEDGPLVAATTLSLD